MPALVGARGVGQILQDDFDFKPAIAITRCTAYFGGRGLPV
jgi:hypothetical protein